MVTTLYLEGARQAVEDGLLTAAQIDPLNYMAALEGAGWAEVGIKYFPYRDKLVYQAVAARKPTGDPDRDLEALEARFKRRVQIDQAQRLVHIWDKAQSEGNHS